MRENFDRAFEHVLRYEGGFSDHPSDPGGATNLGITRAVLSEWIGRPATKAEIRTLKRETAAAIYRARYWDVCRCDELPAGLDLAVFDCAVNQGVGRAARFLQESVGVKTDGKIGPQTLAAVNAFPSARLSVVLGEFMARRMNGYGLLHKLFNVFGLGWSRRLMATHAEAMLHTMVRAA